MHSLLLKSMTLTKNLPFIAFILYCCFALNVKAEENVSATLPIKSAEEDTIDTGEGAGEGEEALPESNGSAPAQALPTPPVKSEDNSATRSQKEPTEFTATGLAKITALNKITAKSQTLAIKAGESQYFGNIEIKIHKCFKSLDPYFPENKILLTVIENKIDEDPITLFQGWMMSSNISVSTFQHPVYEIFAKDCLN